MAVDPRRNIADGAPRVALRSPTSDRGDRPVIRDVQTQVGGTVLVSGNHFHRPPGNLPAQLRSFPQRKTVLNAASDIPVPPGIRIEVSDLVQHKIAKIVDMKKIANLLAGTAETDAFTPAIDTVA